jgi:steroid delta-isomerase-like uncharacterized protein
MIDIIKKHLADFGASNWSEYKASLSNECVYEEYATSTRVKGPDAAVQVAQKWKRAFPDARGTVMSSVMSGDTITVEIQWQGTQTGALESQFGAIAPTNKRVTVNAVEVFKLRNGQIVEARHYFDLLSMLTQLGIATPQILGAQGGAGAGAGQARPRNP